MRRTHRTSALAAAALAAWASPVFAGEEYTRSAVAGTLVETPQDAVVQIATGQDDAVREVSLPFEFAWFGRLHTKVTVCSNGWLAFGSAASAESSNAALPSQSAPNGIVAALWDDLTTGTGSVRTFVSGTAPNRTFVVAWDGVDTFAASSAADLTFQVQLDEASGAVRLAYDPGSTWVGLSYTAGIEDPSGTVAFGAGSTANDLSGAPASDSLFTPRAAVVTGTLVRDRPVASSSGLGVTTETALPVAGIDLELIRTDTGEVAARGRTAADGTFSLTALGVDPSLVFALDVLASGEESRVADAAGAVHRFRLATSIAAQASQSVGTLTLGASADAVNTSIRRAVNVQQAAQRGFAWARAAAAYAVAGTSPAVTAETFPRLDFRFVAGTSAANGRTNYVPATATAAAIANVHDAADNPDAWDDDVILRECGQHVFATISAHPGPQAARSWDASTNAPAAFVDGFATWFACVVQGRAQFIDTKTASTATTFDLEAATPAPKAAKDVTGAVACSLWDLVDPANETRDGFAGTASGEGSTAADVFRAIDLRLDAATGTPAFDAVSFFDVWRTEGPVSDREATSRIWIRHGAFADDVREPDDSAGEAALVTGAQRIDALALSPFNEDRFRFAFAPASPAALTLAVTQTGTTEFDVQILDADGAQVAAATNVGAASKTRVVATTAGAVPSGTYTARVVWRSGAAASYSAAFFEPLRVATTSLPEWTAGVPFKEDVAAAGGVPAYTFTTTGAPAGLSVTNGGTRITGTPTAAGTHTISVAVTDASGAGTSAAAEIPLVVHAALTMPAIFPVPANGYVRADIGTGGTSPSWTAGGSPGGGLVLTGGATLRLSGPGGVAGPSGAPRTFTVTGSASDAVGAALGSTTTRVVVCDLLPPRGSRPVPAGSHFGFWFDAIDGSSVDLRFVFRGSGERPVLSTLLDDTGAAIDLTDRVTTSGRTVRLSGVTARRSGRMFAIFTQGASPLTGTVAVAGDVTPPRDVHGVVVIEEPDDVASVPFQAFGESRLRILVRAGDVPGAPVPALRSLTGPDGGTIALPPSRRIPGGRGVRTDGPRLGEANGEHVLWIEGDRSGTGPVFYRIRIDAPRRTFALYPIDGNVGEF